MIHDDPRPGRDPAPDDDLARCKRASLGREALRVAWDLGALVRRAEREAPEVHDRLRAAVAALLRLGDRLAESRAPERAGDRAARSGTGSFRQGELF